jgi:hypothetical protein
MAKIIDVRGSGGQLVVLGDAMALPTSNAATFTANTPIVAGSIRFNPTLNRIEYVGANAESWVDLTGMSSGGVTGQVLTKRTNQDYDVEWTDAVSGVPEGGTTGQVLRKATDDDHDLAWGSLTKSDVGLANVDNTSDANKPVSIAQQAALDTKAGLGDANTFTANNTFSANVTVSGNLTVNGTTTSVNATNLEITDTIITVAKDNSDGSAMYAGVKAERGSAGNDAYLLWDEANDRFVFQTATNDGQSGSARVPVRASIFQSTVADGTAPLTVTSTTVVPNLNADMLDGLHASDFATTASVDGKRNKTVTIVDSASATYNLTATDADKYLRLSATDAVVNVPLNATSAIPVGTQIWFTQTGTGNVSFAPEGGVTIHTPDDLTLAGAYSSGMLTKVATDAWDLEGHLVASGGGGGGGDTDYIFGTFFYDPPGSYEYILMHTVPVEITIPGNFTGALFGLMESWPTADMTVDVYTYNINVGTLTLSSIDGTITGTTNGPDGAGLPVTVAAGDTIYFVAPEFPDADIRGVAITMKADR